VSKSSWLEALKHAFSLASFDEPLTTEEEAILEQIAQAVVRRRMQTLAILTLESAKPLSYVGSQTLAFFEPLVRALFSVTEYSNVRRILERRYSMEFLITRIEAHEARLEIVTSSEDACP